ncbi:Mitogen-activated protein kinase kinase kinase [Trema orientale]|uniref:Mitogen-activated protein kinase kinase kinase n=1 Tax=Trema orientale TaxID=63057 RepID=A0A2P5FEM0_TREOI|nr:Mitogen-activated protein kinase kinase kinase [Trema orientale]
MDPTLQAVLAAMASFFLITLIFAAAIIICRSRNDKSYRSRNHRHRDRGVPNPRLTSISVVDESASFDPSLSVSMREIVAATRNFSADLIVGDGSFGLVYKAQLAGGPTVAIKKLDPDAFQGFREFRAEMETLGKLRHRNLVKILGYCVSGADRILIYEFIERGNLDIWLHDSSEEEESLRLPLSWATRNKIVRGVANGLAYLHGLEKPIIHRDIKASNVLLDSEFEARIADFGLARTIDSPHSHVSTQVAGTMGYMPPEYKEGFTVATVKADVYSFGVLMLEIGMGRRPNLPMVFDGAEMGLVEWARKMVAQNREIEMVDASISREGLVECEVMEYFRIACLCANEISRERPAMRDVVELLMRNPT